MVTGKRILVIEDEFLIALEMVTVLERAGAAEVEYAATEAEALAAIERSRWDVVVADGNLSGRDIRRVAAALREQAIPFLLVTGYGRNSLPPELADVPLLEKPFRGPQMVKAVSSLCAP